MHSYIPIKTGLIHTQYHSLALIPIVGVGIPREHSDSAYRLHKIKKTNPSKATRI